MLIYPQFYRGYPPYFNNNNNDDDLNTVLSILLLHMFNITVPVPAGKWDKKA